MDRELRASIDRLRESVEALREELLSQRVLSRGDGAEDLQSRLKVLARLEQDGLISEDEYSERKDQMLRDWSRPDPG